MAAYGTSMEQAQPLMIDTMPRVDEDDVVRSPVKRAVLATLAAGMFLGGGVAMITSGVPASPSALRAQEAAPTEAATETPPTDASYFTCPPGGYLGHSEKDVLAKNAKLQALQTKLADLGYVVNERESKYSVYAERGYATYESSAWVKPAGCATLPDEYWTEENNKWYYQYQPDRAPTYITKQVFDQYKFEFHDNWKVASTSFGAYLPCEYGEHESVAMETAVPDGYATVAAVREPLSRFVSAVGELLQRSINHYCPVGYCQEKDSYTTNTLDKLFHQTTWYPLICNSTTLEYDEDAGHFDTVPACSFNFDLLPEVMTAFVHDKKCNLYTYAAEHFTSQSAFVTQQTGVAVDLDAVIRLEEVDDGLAELSVKLGKDSQTCSMSDSNSASDKPGGIPSSSEMMAVLEEIPELLQDLCIIYAQDFICFDYDIPEACRYLFE